VSVPQIEYTRRAWKSDEFIALTSAGHFRGEHLELLEGELWIMSPQEAPHRAISLRIHARMSAAYGESRYHVASHSSIRLSDKSVPEPDVAVVRGPIEDWFDGLPGPLDLVAAIEVVHSTESADRYKQRLYAKAGVAEYWFVDVKRSRIEVHSGPRDDGTYTHTRIAGFDDAIALAEIEATVTVRELLIRPLV